MGIFPVAEAKEKALRERMDALGIREADIEEGFVRSGGRGGQKLNKTATCVYLKHLPTGLGVKCSRARTQGLNRYHARVLLAKKVEALLRGRESEERRRMEKLRRQKRRRSRRAKEKVLAQKRRTSEKKRLRAYRPEDEPGG